MYITYKTNSTFILVNTVFFAFSFVSVSMYTLATVCTSFINFELYSRSEKY